MIITTINEVKHHREIGERGKLALYSPTETLHMIFDVQRAIAGFDEYDYDLIEDSCLAVCELRFDTVHEGPKNTMELYAMAAREGYGPMMFLCAMQEASALSNGMIPHTSPSYVSQDAAKMIASFYDGPNAAYAMGESYPGRHKEDYLNFIYQTANPVDLSTMQRNVGLILDGSDGTYAEYMWEAGESWLTNRMREIYHVT